MPIMLKNGMQVLPSTINGIYYFNSHQLIVDRLGIRADGWACYIGSGTLNGTRYFIMKNLGHKKYLISAKYCNVPYGYKF